MDKLQQTILMILQLVLNDSFDDAISMMISKDQAEMASGTIAFEN